MNTIARQKRKKSIRAKLVGSSQRPRLNIFRSSKHIYASLINDEDGRTLVWASDRGIKDNMTKSEKTFRRGKRKRVEILKIMKEYTRELEFDEKVVQVNRVSKKTAGGNKIGFSVLVVIGDRNSRVGVGLC